MDNIEAIKELKEIIEDRKSYLAGDYDKTFDKHIQALEYAIKELEKTAPEVPVQEQYVISIDSQIISEVFSRFDKMHLNQQGNNHTLGQRIWLFHPYLKWYQ